MRVSMLLAAATTTAVLVVPVTASAATKTVTMGPPASAGKSLQKLVTDVDAFFPTTVSVHAGDKVRFLPFGLHSVDLPAKGKKPIGLLTPNGTAASTDAAGAAFWFNGQPTLGFNPVLLKSGFGKTLAYAGSKSVNSGLPLANKPKPVLIRFTKAGTFTYYCDVHPGMKGTVRVLPKAKKVPTPAADAKSAAKQLTSALKVAAKLAKSTAPTGTVSVGESGSGGVERFAFAPSALTVSPGTTVTFSMPTGSREDHTATTGPGNPEQAPTSYLGKIAASFQGSSLDPLGTYPSDPPTAGPAALTPQLHGNGFWNSGVLDTTSATPLPASNKVTFAGAGTYEFYCLIHPFMHATVTVK